MTAQSDFCSVYVTVPDVDTARQIARVVLEKNLAACANTLPNMESLYWWEGKVESAQEVVVLFKTKGLLFEKLSQAVCELHPYEVPCIVKWPIVDGLPSYLNWIDKSVVGE